jgi:hypothetical protein
VAEGIATVPMRSPQNWSATGFHDRRAGLDRAFERARRSRVRRSRSWPSARRGVRAERAHVGPLVAQHQVGIADADLGVADAFGAVGPGDGQAVELPAPEGGGVEVEARAASSTMR